MQSPRVSVLIPAYNGAAFLSECLDSVLAQDFEDFEVLVSDDESSDASPDVIADYARRDARIRWWRNSQNLGIGANFNACLRQARGEFVKYVLQDDKLLSPSALRKLVAAMSNDPSVSLAVSASRLIDGQSAFISLRNRFGDSCVRDGKEVIIHCFSHERANLIGEPSLALFRKRQAERGFDEQFRQLLDLEMWFYLLEQGRFAFIAEPLCAFRQHPAQYTEVNARTGAAADEHLHLITRYYAKPWMRQLATPDMLFTRINYLRKHYGDRAHPLISDMTKSLGWPRYAAKCATNRLRRRLQRFRHSLLKRGLWPRTP